MTRSSVCRLVCVAVFFAVAAGCGKKGDPRPPILLVPAPTTDFTVVQRGDTLLLDLAYPQTTAAGTPLPGLDELAVWQLVWRAPAVATTPPEVDERQFLAGARPVRVLEGEDLAAAVAGDRIALTLPVPPAAEPEAAGQPVVSLAVKTQGPGGEESVFSNRVSFPLAQPPAPPTAIEAEGHGRGIRVEWSYPDMVAAAGEEEPPAEVPSPEALGGEEPEAPGDQAADETTTEAGDEPEPAFAGFNVYRRKATERTYGPPLRTLGARARQFLDESALFGESYIYTVTAVASRRPVVVESSFAEEVEVIYRDVYAPPVPEGLVALTEGTRVRLVWAASDAPDLAGYRIYRRGPDTQEFRPLTDEPVLATDYSDTTPAAGATYTYRVTAVDRLGNESRPSETTTAVIR